MSKALLLPVGWAVVINLKFSNMRFLRRGEDVKAYPARNDRREAIRLLVPDGLSGCHGLPRMVRPNLNCVFLHMLTVVEPFHGGDPIDAAWFR